MAVALPRTDPAATGLRRAAARSPDADAARRMLALARVLEGRSRPEAAPSCGLDRPTLRDGGHRVTEEGRPGRSRRPAPGAKPRRSPDPPEEGAKRVRCGPDLAEPGVVRWRRADRSQVIEARFGVRGAERRGGARVAAARRSAPVRAAAPPGPGSRRPRGASTNVAARVAAAVPEPARAKPRELGWPE